MSIIEELGISDNNAKTVRAGLQIKCNGKPEKEIALKLKQIKSHHILCKSLMIGEGGVGRGH